MNGRQEKITLKKIIILLLCLLLIGCSTEKKTNLSKGDINSSNIDISNKLTKTDYIDKDLAKVIKKIVIRDRTDEILQTIIDNQKIKSIISTLYCGCEVTGTVTSEDYLWCLKMYDSADSLVLEVFIWKNGYFGFTKNKEYSFAQGNYDKLNSIINY